MTTKQLASTLEAVESRLRSVIADVVLTPDDARLIVAELDRLRDGVDFWHARADDAQRTTTCRECGETMHRVELSACGRMIPVYWYCPTCGHESEDSATPQLARDE